MTDWSGASVTCVMLASRWVISCEPTPTPPTSSTAQAASTAKTRTACRHPASRVIAASASAVAIHVPRLKETVSGTRSSAAHAAAPVRTARRPGARA